MLSSYDYTNELSGENKNGLVYVIDDDADVRESIKWLLESTNYRVEDYESGETFIAQFNENVPSVILCDLRMPGISGSDVQDHLLRRRIDAPFIFITGHGDVDLAVTALQEGAIDFIQKPVDDERLIQAIAYGVHLDLCRRGGKADPADILHRIRTLTERELELARLLAAGARNRRTPRHCSANRRGSSGINLEEAWGQKSTGTASAILCT